MNWLKELKKTILTHTDDRIMINGINVIQCRHLTREAEEDGSYYWFCELAPISCSKGCVNFKDCYYKQLKRKEQKLKEIKQYCNNCNLKADFTACDILQIIESEGNE